LNESGKMSEEKKKIRVLVVDDSAVVRQIVSKGLAQDSELDVIGTAGDPFVARDKILRDRPDVITLDIEMPKMDGLTFLKRLMEYYPIPVVILSSLAGHGTDVALKALENGAVDVFPKPKCDVKQGLTESMFHLARAVKAAAHAKLPNLRVFRGAPENTPAPKPPPPVPGNIIQTTDGMIAMGASTGGTEALKTVLSALPPDSPGIAAVIHMPEGFTKRYAERLNELCAIEVSEAQDGDWLHPGRAVIARGDRHISIVRSGARFIVQIRNGPAICHHRPSVEVLFQSVAIAAGRNALGVIMTGMGADGADGMVALKKAGAHTVAQDEATCVVFGMPREAIERGGATAVLPLNQIAGECVRWSAARATQGCASTGR
jgi:two-component system chemotaxis response regulator CheB